MDLKQLPDVFLEELVMLKLMIIVMILTVLNQLLLMNSVLLIVLPLLVIDTNILLIIITVPVSTVWPIMKLMITVGEIVLMKEFIITDIKHYGMIGITMKTLQMVNIDLNVWLVVKLVVYNTTSLTVNAVMVLVQM